MINRIKANKKRLFEIKKLDTAKMILRRIEKDSISKLHYAFLLHQRVGLKNSDIPIYGVKERGFH